jgi:hypothetical protein
MYKVLISFIFCLSAGAAVITIAGAPDSREHRDAKFIQGVAKNNGQHFQKVFSRDKEDLKKKIAIALIEAKKNMKPGEPLIIHFMGHGWTSDPKDPKKSGIISGGEYSGKILNYEEITEIFKKHVSDKTVKLIGGSCFSGGIHHISRELNKAKPGSTCSISITSHATVGFLQTDGNEYGATSGSYYSRNMWGAVASNPKINMAQMYSNSIAGAFGQMANNSGFTTMSSTDSIEFYNKSGTHSPKFKEKWEKLLGTSSDPERPTDYINNKEARPAFAQKDETMRRIFDEEFGELSFFANDEIIEMQTQLEENSFKWYDDYKKQKHKRKSKTVVDDTYSEFLGDLFGLEKQIDGGIILNSNSYSCPVPKVSKQTEAMDLLSPTMKNVVTNLLKKHPKADMSIYLRGLISKYNNNYPSYMKDLDHWKTDLEKVVSSYAKEKLLLVDSCKQLNKSLTDHECERGGYSYLTKEHNIKLKDLEERYRKKMDKIRDLNRYPSLAEYRYNKGEILRTARKLAHYDKIKNSSDKRVIDGIHKCETKPIFES